MLPELDMSAGWRSWQPAKLWTQSTLSIASTGPPFLIATILLGPEEANGGTIMSADRGSWLQCGTTAKRSSVISPLIMRKPSELRRRMLTSVVALLGQLCLLCTAARAGIVGGVLEMQVQSSLPEWSSVGVTTGSGLCVAACLTRKGPSHS